MKLKKYSSVIVIKILQFFSLFCAQSNLMCIYSKYCQIFKEEILKFFKVTVALIFSGR